MLCDFDISKHVVSNEKDIVIGAPVTREMLRHVYNLSNLFLYLNALERGYIHVSTLIFAPSLNMYKTQLMPKVGSLGTPMLFESDRKFNMVFMQTAQVKYNECLEFQADEA